MIYIASHIAQYASDDYTATTRGARHEHHPVSDIYAHRPLLSSNVFAYAQTAVHRATGWSPAFRPRGARSAGVSLLRRSLLRHAVDSSATLRDMDPETVMSALGRAVAPFKETPPEGLPAEVGDVVVLPGENGQHLAARVHHPDLLADQTALFETLYNLGGVALGTDDLHISFGLFTRRVPPMAVRALEDHLPDTFPLASIAIEGPSGGAVAA